MAAFNNDVQRLARSVSNVLHLSTSRELGAAQ